MVLSKLNPEVDYPDNPELNKSDKNMKTQAWYYNLDNNNIIIALGREWIQEDDLVTVPIYLISPEDDTVIKQIGLFEMTHETYYANLETDDDGDEILNINKLDEPLIYNRGQVMSSPDVVSPLVSPVVSPLSSPVGSPVVSPLSSPVPSSLPEQTEEMSKSEYINNPSGAWINKYLKTSHFKIEDVNGDGNCFFYVVRDAMKTVGKTYTIPELRQMLLEYKNLEASYNNAREIIADNLKEIEISKKKYKECTEKLKNKQVKTKTDTERYMKECETIQEDVNNAKEILRELNATKLKDLDTFEKYKEYVTTKECWAAEWSIRQIEQSLNIKVIIFSNEQYKHLMEKGEENRTDPVILCTQSEVTKPDFYILANYINDEHYQLVYFKNTLAFKFNQLPYMLRSKLVERCMIGDESAGWNKIEDFKEFKLEIQKKPSIPVEKVEKPKTKTPPKKVPPSKTKKQSPTPKKQTKKNKDKDNICHKLPEIECNKLVEECTYRKGKVRQYCAKRQAKK